jgi:hypothetical protein
MTPVLGEWPSAKLADTKPIGDSRGGSANAMSAALYEVNLPPQILVRGFWLYAWKIVGQTGQRFCYVGMTGDISGVAQSPYARAGAHLGSNPNSNALRQHLARQGIEPERCKTLTFLAYGPVIPYQPKPHADFEPRRKRVGALERKLWTAAAVNNTMLNGRPQFSEAFDASLWEKVRAAFASHLDLAD